MQEINFYKHDEVEPFEFSSARFYSRYADANELDIANYINRVVRGRIGSYGRLLEKLCKEHNAVVKELEELKKYVKNMQQQNNPSTESSYQKPSVKEDEPKQHIERIQQYEDKPVDLEKENQDLETENLKLKQELENLQKATGKNVSSKIYEPKHEQHEDLKWKNHDLKWENFSLEQEIKKLKLQESTKKTNSQEKVKHNHAVINAICIYQQIQKKK